MHGDFHRNDAKGFVQEEEEGQPQMMCRCCGRQPHQAASPPPTPRGEEKFVLRTTFTVETN